MHNTAKYTVSIL